MTPCFPCMALAALLSAQEPREAPAARVVVAVDPRVELLSIVLRLAGNPEYGRAAYSAYTRAVEERFGPFKEHELVKRAASLRRTVGISYDAAPSLAVHLRPDTSLELLAPLDPWPEGLDSRWRKSEALPDFLDQLRAFARDSGFFEFFASQRPFHERVEAAYRQAAAQDDIVGWFDGLFGERPGAGFVLVPGLLNGPQNYGVRFAPRSGPQSLYQVLGVGFGPGGAPSVGSGFTRLYVHEMAHSYANPLIDKHLEEVRESGEKLFAATREAMRKQAYGNGYTVLCESLVRACVVLHALERGGEQAAVRALAEEEQSSFFWTAELLQVMRRFRAAPPPSGRFADFMPEIADALRAAAGRDWNGERRPFRGMLNGVFARAGLIVVLPDDCPAELGKYLETIHDSVYRKKGAKKLAAGKVTREIAAKSPLVLYGTPASNPHLARVAEAAGWSLAKGELRLGERVFKGEGLALIACWPSPFGDGLPVAVYAAEKDTTLVGVNGLFHGPTDWVVARRGEDGKLEKLAEGDFPKDLQNRWRSPRAERE